MLRILTAIVLAPALAALLWLSAGRRGERADFVVASDALRTIDPQRVSWLDEIQVANALFEGLTRLDPQTCQPEPAVAQRWTVSDDGREYTFFLRPAARWSNGRPVLAEHFRAAWLRALDPQVASQYASLLFVIEGAREYYEGARPPNRDRETAGSPDRDGEGAVAPGASPEKALASASRSDPNRDRETAGSPSRDREGASHTESPAIGIDVLDPHTLRVRLAVPCPYFLDLTSFPTLAPLWQPALERPDVRGAAAPGESETLWTQPQRIVCDGAFVLEEWDFKRRLRLRRNPHYWDAAAVGLDTIDLFITSDANTALIGYETGQIDLIRGLKPEIAVALARQAAAGRRSDFHVGDRFATYFFRVNCRRPPLDNADLRKALALAIDKQAICERVMGMGETPADTYVPRGALRQMPRRAADGSTFYYQPPAGLGAGLTQPQRVALAREHLSRSGFERNAASRPIELFYSPDPAYQRRIAEAVAAMWESALGIRVELRSQERKVLSERIRTLDYDVVRSDWYGDYMDPSTFLEMFSSGNGQNRTGWSNGEYDRLVASAMRAPDDARRFELFADAERILCEQELPILPLFFKRGNYLLNPAFGGVADNLRDVLPIHRVRRVAEVESRPF